MWAQLPTHQRLSDSQPCTDRLALEQLCPFSEHQVCASVKWEQGPQEILKDKDQGWSAVSKVHSEQCLRCSVCWGDWKG